MRVVLDTNILARATGASAGPARAVFLRLLDPPHSILVSRSLLDELRRVMNYPRVQKIHGLTTEEIEKHVHDIELAAVIVDLPALLPSSVAADPDDNPVVATAVNGVANVLCTRDQHLHSAEVVRYCGQYSIRVLTDLDVLVELRALDAPTP
jgi:uncharacterized protein